MTLAEFEQQVFAVAMASPVCGIPAVRRLTPTSIASPEQHDPLPGAMSFAQFVYEVERHQV